MNIKDRIKTALIDAIIILPEDVEEKILQCKECEGTGGAFALSAIKKNIEIAKKERIPLCQDTGMFWCWAEIGRNSNVSIPKLEKVILQACMEASKEGFFRKSVVTDPIYERRNTGTNLPPIISYTLADGDDVKLSFLFKGFGSENCSSVRMLNPTAGEDGVVSAVVDMMKAAGGKPCPPTFLGIGVGGTMDRAAFLSKAAFFKKGESELEKRIQRDVNKLGIGPGGLGGSNTCLSVQLLSEPTHIAGLPVAMTVNCWADRKCVIKIEKGEL